MNNPQQQQTCHKPRSYKIVWRTNIHYKLHEATDDLGFLLFEIHTSRITGTDLKLNDVEVDKYFLECPNNKCG